MQQEAQQKQDLFQTPVSKPNPQLNEMQSLQEPNPQSANTLKKSMPRPPQKFDSSPPEPLGVEKERYLQMS